MCTVLFLVRLHFFTGFYDRGRFLGTRTVSMSAGLSRSACARVLRNPTTNSLSSGFLKGGAGRHQTYEDEKKSALCLFLIL